MGQSTSGTSTARTDWNKALTAGAPRSGAGRLADRGIGLGRQPDGHGERGGQRAHVTGPDGSAALDYTGLTAYDAPGKALPASLQVRTVGGRQELLIHVNDAGARARSPSIPSCSRPSSRRPTARGRRISATRWPSAATRSWSGPGRRRRQHRPGCGLRVHGLRLRLGGHDQTAKLTASDGRRATRSATRLRSAATRWWSERRTPRSAATRTGGGLRLHRARLRLGEHDPDRQTHPVRWRRLDDEFGDSVAISGNTVVVGAAMAGQRNQRARPTCSRSPASGWANMTQTAKLTASDGAAGEVGYRFRSAATRWWSESTAGSTAQGRPTCSPSPAPVGRT